MKIFLLFFSLCILHFSYACSSSSRCSWTVCSTSYSEFFPKPSPGTCTLQKSLGTSSITTHSKSNGCPASQPCSEAVRYRSWCSCQEVYSCWWSNWNEWSGSINHGSCGPQYRYRVVQKVFQYTEKPSCHGSITSCHRDYESESRTWCSCKKASSCALSEWASWSSPPNPNLCVKQKRVREIIASYIYEGQQTNCDGITDKCVFGSLEDERVLCNCPYKECIEGEWTEWEMHIWNGNCPTERRLQHYRSVEKYRIAHVNCDSVGPKICPDPVGHIREKEITCPQLPLDPHGIHDDVCNGASSKCQSICTMSCKKGFKLIGNLYITCQGDGKWSGLPGKCEDIEPPNIVCPTLTSEYFNLPNKNYAMIDLLEATATDNSGLKPEITMDKSSPLKVFVGNPVRVLYTATDSSGNKRSCEVHLSVKDNEPPKTISCPSDMVIETGQVPHQLFWDEPKFHDNVDESHVNINPSHQSGSFFPRGKHKIVYIARDQSFNKVQCVFTIQLDLKACTLYDPPENGALNCNVMKNGIAETHICTVSCKPHHWFLEGDDFPQLYNFYVCGEDEQWRGQNEITSSNPVFFVPIQRGIKPWPDCSVGEVPENIKTNFQVYAGKCVDEVEQLQMKQAFINAMKNDFVIDNLYCKTSADHCTVDNLVIICSSNSYSANNMIIEFTLNVRGHSQNINKLQITHDSITALKSTLNEKVFKANVIDEKDFTSYESIITCKDGYELVNINGSDNNKGSINRCIQCAKGTYFDRNISKCKVCEVGTYQPNEAQMSCEKCSENTSTNGIYAHDYYSCKEICKPGTYSSNGLENCFACPIGTYQPMSKSTECFPCPAGTVSANVGSTSLTDCLLPGIEIVIRSEGFGDPYITKGTGISSIYVNNIQYSSMKRGMNFVALNVYTGALVDSVAFDWHGDFQACDKTYDWFQALKNNSIVLVAAQDEATYYAFEKCYYTLESLGGKHPFQREYRSSFAMIGYKGLHSVTWVQQTKSSFGKGPTILTENIKLRGGVEIFIHSEGCGDPNIIGCGTSKIYVDNIQYGLMKRGMNFVAINVYTGILVESVAFDWYGDFQACDKTYSWFQALQNDSIVLVAAQDETTQYAFEKCYYTLELLGGKHPFQREYRSSFAMIGYKGLHSVTWVQQTKSSFGKGPTILTEKIKLLRGIDIFIRSEGCADPYITGCGISTIHVDKIQYSLMKRGMNFVAINAFTGAFIESVAFDWHGDFQACDKTYSWFQALKNDSIVLVAAQDETIQYAFEKCYYTLELLGGKHPFQREYRSSFAMIGYKGLHSVTWVQQMKSTYGNGPTILATNINLLPV